jgi:hypothetical protein
MTEPNDTQRLISELADYIQQTIAAVSQAGAPAPELPEVTDGGLKRILGSHVIDQQTLERVRETWATFQVGALGRGRAVEHAQERYDGER